MGKEPEIFIQLNQTLDSTPYNDDISDLESCIEDNMNPSRRRFADSDEDISKDDGEEDDFLDFPPNFDFQSKSIPSHFLCSLTKAIMIHPVIDPEGNTYERRAILRWLDLEDVSPVTQNPLSEVDLVENKHRSSAIKKYREEIWNAYNKDTKEKNLFKRDKSYKNKQKMMRKELRRLKKERNKSNEHDMLSDKSTKLLFQMQEELDLLQSQHDEKEDDLVEPHIEYLHQQKRERKKPKSAAIECIISNQDGSYTHGNGEFLVSSIVRKQSSFVDGAAELNTSTRRKPSSKSPQKECKSISNSPRSNADFSSRQPGDDLSSSLIVRKQSRMSLSPNFDHANPNARVDDHLDSPKLSVSSVNQKTEPKSLHRESDSYSKQTLQDTVIRSRMKSLKLVQYPPSPPIIDSGPEYKSSRTLVGDSALSTPAKSTTRERNKHFSKSPAPPQPNTIESSTRMNRPSSKYQNPPGIHERASIDPNKYSITERIIAEVNGCIEPILTKGYPTTASTTSLSQHSNNKLDHGWSVPIGVHKVICDAPGLLVTSDVHRRSAPVKRITDTNEESSARSKQLLSNDQLVIPPGAYVEVIETQVHGDRVRGKILFEEISAVHVDESRKATKKMRIKKLTRINRKRNKIATTEHTKQILTNQYSGWVSLKWSGEKDGSNVDQECNNSRISKATDEDAGPWTEPVLLGVYCVNFGRGLPVRSSPDRNSTLVGMLEKGQYVEVVETQITGDRVRARCIAAASSKGEKAMNGWISIFNTVTGSSSASPVPCGAYISVAQKGCTVTERGSLNSNIKSLLKRGSFVDIVSTCIEDDTVRGLISTGGYVTLIGLKRTHIKKNGKPSSAKDEQYLMYVPTGVYKVIDPDGLPVFMGVESDSPSALDLKLDCQVIVVETCVRNERVVGRIIAVINENVRHEVHGWINLFESKRRLCKFVRK